MHSLHSGEPAVARPRARAVALLLLVVGILAPLPAAAQSTFQARLRQITSRPEFKHSLFGVELYDLDARRTIFELNGPVLMTPASTTKLLTMGTALKVLGPDYRFHTKVYRTGPVEAGVLKGDLVLVASGDPDLSNRIQPDGTMAFENEDHAYDGSPDTKAVPGDPLAVLREMAKQVAGKGIERVEGHVIVDVSMFPEGARELGSGVVISPVAVNDNLVDVTIGPGGAEGAPVTLSASPSTAYVRFVNEATTAAAGTRPEIRWSKDEAQPDGSHVVTVTGTFPAGEHPWLFSYAVPQPSRYAEMTFAEALRDAGVKVTARPKDEAPDLATLTNSYTAENVVAEHVSPPLSEEVKVTLKVSQNLHASMMPYILGAVVKGEHENAEQAGFDVEREFLTKAGLDLTGASQGDGAGGAQSAFFAPDFMVRYLAYMAGQKDIFPALHKALPILGVDGTLWNIQTKTNAVGHVHAKTGTFSAWDKLNKRPMLTAKGLAGYMTTAAGRHLAFAFYLNRMPVTLDALDAITKMAGQTLGEIAVAAYELPVAKATR